MDWKKRRMISDQTMTAICLVVLVLYPLRKIGLGVDLMDAGYNYANFRYPGPEYMDSMWYFATFLSEIVGGILIRLPFADKMLVLNIYTGLIVSLLATAGFLFCKKEFHLPAVLLLVGELLACNLCWLPTAVLYNYLTFLLMTGCCILLYRGLTVERYGLLFAAGVLLGLNVGVRFSNLVQVAYILAVWCFLFWKKKPIAVFGKVTGLCVGGFAAGVLLFLIPILFVYGGSAYFDAVERLFAMSDSARDYSVLAMLGGLPGAFVEESYHLKRFLLIAGAGTVLLVVVSLWAGKFPDRKKYLIKPAKVFVCLATAGVFLWQIRHRFWYPDFATYESIRTPAVCLLFFALVIGLLVAASPSFETKERLAALLLVLNLFVTSLGGNNGIFYCFNNLFLVMPFLLYLLMLIFQKESGVYYTVSLLAAELSLVVLLLSFVFGNTFVYEEATGGRDFTAKVTKSEVLWQVKSGEAKIGALESLDDYMRSMGEKPSCILFGQIPGVSYYLDLPPAFPIWCDLDSYSTEDMEGDLSALSAKVKNGEQIPPVAILESSWAEYLEIGIVPDRILGANVLEKAHMLKGYLDENGYKKTFSNEKYVVFAKIQ